MWILVYTNTRILFIGNQWRKNLYTGYIITRRGHRGHAYQLNLEPVGCSLIIMSNIPHHNHHDCSGLFFVTLKNTVHQLSCVNREQQQMQFFKFVWRYVSVSKHWFAKAIYALKYHYSNIEILQISIKSSITQIKI